MPHIKLDYKDNKELIEWLTQTGFITDSSIKDKDIAEAKADRQKKLYHNTKVLLKSYRKLTWLLKSYPYEIADELQTPVQDIDRIIEHLDQHIEFDEAHIIGRLKSINKTRQLVDEIQKALTAVKNYPEGGLRLYYILYYTYISETEHKTQGILEEIMYAENKDEAMAERTYYHLRKKAINIMSVFLWSAPDKVLDNWINLSLILKKDVGKR